MIKQLMLPAPEQSTAVIKPAIKPISGGSDEAFISFQALMRILTPYSRRDSGLLTITSFGKDCICLMISGAPYEGCCLYDTKARMAYAISHKWAAYIEEAKLDAMDKQDAAKKGLMAIYDVKEKDAVEPVEIPCST